MLSNIYMVLLLEFAPEYEVEIFYLFSRILDNLSFEIKSQLTFRIKGSRFFIFYMKFRKESAL